MDSMFYPQLGGDAVSAAEMSELDYPLGCRRRDSFGNEYMFIKYDDGVGVVSAGLGDLVGRDASETTDPSLVMSADKTEWADDDSAAGLAASVFDSADDKIYGWILVKGYLKTAMNGAGLSATVDGGVSDGHLLLPTVGGTDAQLDSVAYASVANATRVVGRAFIDDATNDLTDAFVDFESFGMMPAA